MARVRCLLLLLVMASAQAGGARAERDATRGSERVVGAELLRSIHAYRGRNGVGALAPSAALDALAEEHSRTMARERRLTHDGFRQRAARAGSTACVENVGWNYAGARSQLQGWIDSPSHNVNLLDPGIRQGGIGEEAGYVTFLGCR
jgi:uncharacterized protein YkwD